jgi:hypothetical protein
MLRVYYYWQMAMASVLDSLHVRMYTKPHLTKNNILVGCEIERFELKGNDFAACTPLTAYCILRMGGCARAQLARTWLIHRHLSNNAVARAQKRSNSH